MEEREYLIELFLIYKNLLSTKEIKYFENYYFEDLSLTEIAEIENVSRSYTSKLINSIKDKLNDYETKLNLYKKSEIIKKVIEKEENEELINLLNEVL